MSKKRWIAVGVLVAVTGTVTPYLCTGASKQKTHVGYDNTPFLPGGKWRVHDGRRPQPVVITPGSASTQKRTGKPPSDATVLFDGTDLSKWQSGNGRPAGWNVENGYMEVPSRGTSGGGDISTRDKFGDCQLHIEWATPKPSKGSGQGLGNSGVFLFGRYEVQVLNSYQNVTYPDGQAAAIYGQYPPLVNASRKPGEWQVYDILFTAPRFNKKGKLESPATITVLHNGVVVHNHTTLMGSTRHRELAEYSAHGSKGSLRLQDHGDPVRYRNIWIRPLKQP